MDEIKPLREEGSKQYGPIQWIGSYTGGGLLGNVPVEIGKIYEWQCQTQFLSDDILDATVSAIIGLSETFTGLQVIYYKVESGNITIQFWYPPTTQNKAMFREKPQLIVTIAVIILVIVSAIGIIFIVLDKLGILKTGASVILDVLPGMFLTIAGGLTASYLPGKMKIASLPLVGVGTFYMLNSLGLIPTIGGGIPEGSGKVLVHYQGEGDINNAVYVINRLQDLGYVVDLSTQSFFFDGYDSYVMLGGQISNEIYQRYVDAGVFRAITSADDSNPVVQTTTFKGVPLYSAASWDAIGTKAAIDIILSQYYQEISPGNPILSVSPLEMDLKDKLSETLTISNTGTGRLDWSISFPANDYFRIGYYDLESVWNDATSGSLNEGQSVGLIVENTSQTSDSFNVFVTIEGVGLQINAQIYQNPTLYVLKGNVTDFSTGMPIVSALIEAGTKSSTTDTNGNYEITFFEGMSIQVTSKKTGYQIQTTAITLYPGENIQNFILNPLVLGITYGGIVSNAKLATSIVPETGEVVTDISSTMTVSRSSELYFWYYVTGYHDMHAKWYIRIDDGEKYYTGEIWETIPYNTWYYYSSTYQFSIGRHKLDIMCEDSVVATYIFELTL